MKPLIVFVFSFLCWKQIVLSQQVNGHWFGVGKVTVPGEHSAYMAEMILKQKGNTVTGELQYYFRDSLFSVPLSGQFSKDTRQLSLRPIPFIYYLSRSTKNGIDCILKGNFTLIVNRNESLLNGAFESDEAHRYTTPAIQFRFRYSTDTIPAPIQITEEATDEIVSNDSVPAPKDTLASDLHTAADSKDSMHALREKVFVREIEVSGGPLRLELYDNGSIDYDSVSVYLNNRLLIPKSKLDHRAIRKTILLDSTLPYNELSMFAENLGMVPPNTAALIIYDGDKRHELVLTSDLNKTATIRIRKRKHIE
ncbi:hypothetical protein [Sediminibacterium goheungense]|uniref:Uncharacterized protein n=1 Tax=Sediminibacterium goheungense TaxID=1086393 RepID=A0A4R6IZ02_9BACT|nr:hypothetical protein [Sediminibacterium goheungense]TDO28089.1 hypothetical protein BC659_0147 [Sediminibacterium goheungense]